MHNLFWCQLRGQTLSTKCINYDIEIHVRKKTEGLSKNGQSRKTDNIEHTRHKTIKQNQNCNTEI